MTGFYFYVCANTVDEAFEWARSHQLALDEWRFYNDPAKLHGGAGQFVVFLSTAWKRADYGELRHAATQPFRHVLVVDATTGELFTQF